jgi:hypothetical protein
MNLKIRAIFAILSLIVVLLPQPVVARGNSDATLTLALSYRKAKRNLPKWLDYQDRDLILFAPKAPNQNWDFDRYGYFLTPSGRFQYQPSLSLGIGDGWLTAKIGYAPSFSGRNTPKYIDIELFGLIPVVRLRVNGGG